jgi:hypothetical protein
MYGQDWPSHGEIDVRNLNSDGEKKAFPSAIVKLPCLFHQIFEGWNNNTRGRATLHTTPG